jgi:intein/homing endonuclease
VCGQNGCIDGKTQIFVDGKRMQIKNAPNIFTTKIYDDKNKIFIDSTAIKIKTGKQKVYRVKLKDGKEIMATADHKWLTDKGWKKTIDLGKGENIISYDGR